VTNAKATHANDERKGDDEGASTRSERIGALYIQAARCRVSLLQQEGVFAEGDREAWQLIDLALAHLFGAPAPWLLAAGKQRHPAAKDMCAAWAVLVGGKKNQQDAEIIGWIELAVGWAQSDMEPVHAARNLVDMLGTIDPSIQRSGIVGVNARALVDIPKLAKMLEHHHVATKQGRVPLGKYTTRQIVDYLTGDPNASKRASKATRRRKEKNL
jgi:hypothetical protein